MEIDLWLSELSVDWWKMGITVWGNEVEHGVSGWGPLTFGNLKYCVWNDDLQDHYEIYGYESICWLTLKSRAFTTSGFSNMTSGTSLGKALRRFALLRLVLWSYTYELAAFCSQGMANQRKTSLLQCPISIEVRTYMPYYLPVSNIDIVVPSLANAFLQEAFEARGPHPTESRPHLFWFDVGMSMHPLVLDRSGKRGIEHVANMGVGVCDIEIFCTTITLRNAWRAYIKVW